MLNPFFFCFYKSIQLTSTMIDYQTKQATYIFDLNKVSRDPLLLSATSPIPDGSEQLPCPTHLLLDMATSKQLCKNYNSIKGQSIFAFPIDHLVRTQPLPHLIQIRVEVLEKVAIVSKLRTHRVFHVYPQNLPIHLPLVNESDCPKHLHLVDVS